MSKTTAIHRFRSTAGSSARWFLILILAALSACSGQPAPPEPVPTSEPTSAPVPSPTAFAPQEKVTLRLGTWAEGEEAARIDSLVAEINASAENFEIEHEPEPEAYYAALQTGLAAGSAPDLFWLEPEWMPMLAAQSVLLDLSPYLQAGPVSPAADVMDYFPEVLRGSIYAGRYYSLPVSADPLMLYFNEALFDAAGLPLPSREWTWGDLSRAAAALTVDDDNDGRLDRWGFAMDGVPTPLPFVWQSGGELISLDLTSAPVDTPEAVRGLDFFARLVYGARTAPPAEILDGQTVEELFRAGRLGMLTAPASLPVETWPEVQAGCAVLPAGPAARATLADSVGLAIPAATQHPAEAYVALVRLAEALQAEQVVPPRRSLATAEQIGLNQPGKYASAEALSAAAYQMRVPASIPRQVAWQETFASQLAEPLARLRRPAAELAAAARPALEALLPGGREAQ